MGDKFQLSYKSVVAAYNMHDADMQSKLSFALCSLGVHNEPIKSLRAQINEVIQSSFHLSPRRQKHAADPTFSAYDAPGISSCLQCNTNSLVPRPLLLLFCITSGSGLHRMRISDSQSITLYCTHMHTPKFQQIDFYSIISIMQHIFLIQ